MVPPSIELPLALSRKYVIEGVVATGGFGVVLRARQRDLDRPVAIKMLRPEAFELEPEALQRFHTEAQIAAHLSHPNIVGVIEQCFEGGAWIVYEFVEGRSLRQIIDEDGPMQWDRATEAIEQVADALAVAHAQGVIHRDMKPENVLQASAGWFRVTDFGIAKWTQGRSVQTRTGLTLGSPAYMAPELIRGEGATFAVDYYSMGLMFHELVAGEHPFTGNGTVDLLTHQLLTAMPPLIGVRPGVPQSLDHLLARLTDKNPTKRLTDPIQLKDGLRALLAQRDRRQDNSMERSRATLKAPRVQRKGTTPTLVHVTRPDLRRRAVLLGFAGALALVMASILRLATGTSGPDRSAPRASAQFVPGGSLRLAGMDPAAKGFSLSFLDGGGRTWTGFVPSPATCPIRVAVRPTADVVSGPVSVGEGVRATVRADELADLLLTLMRPVPTAVRRCPDKDQFDDLRRSIGRGPGAARTFQDSALALYEKAGLGRLWRSAASLVAPILSSSDLDQNRRAAVQSSLFPILDACDRFRAFGLSPPLELIQAFPPGGRVAWNSARQLPAGRDLPVTVNCHEPADVAPDAVDSRRVFETVDLGIKPGESSARCWMRGSWDLLGERRRPTESEKLISTDATAEFHLADAQGHPIDPARVKTALLALRPAPSPTLSQRYRLNESITLRVGCSPFDEKVDAGSLWATHEIDPRDLKSGANHLRIHAVATMHYQAQIELSSIRELRVIVTLVGDP